MVQYKNVVLINTSIGSLMSSIDGSIVIISLPTIARDLSSTSVFDLLWIVLGYQLVSATTLVNFGRFSDMYGRIKFYKYGFVIFTAGSALCSLSQTGDQLVVFRLIQGVGSALLTSNSGAIITDAFPVEERGRALGISSVPSVVGSIFGLTLGGVLTQTLGWQSIFWVNLPIGVVATAWAHFKLHELAALQTGKRVDFVGNVTFAGSLIALLTSITLYSLGSLPLAYFVGLIVASVVLMAVFIYAELKVKDPMFNLALFKIRQFAGANAGALLNNTARGAATLVLSLYLQGPTMNLSSGTAGLYLIPFTFTTTIWAPLAGTLADRFGARVIASSGLFLGAVGFFILENLGPVTSFIGLLIPLVVIGTGVGLYVTPNRMSVMNAVPPKDRGVASGTNTTLFNVGVTLSQGIAFWIMSLYIPVPEIQNMLTHGSAFTTVGPSFIEAIDAVYSLAAVLMLLAVIPSVLRGKKYTYETSENDRGGSSASATKSR